MRTSMMLGYAAWEELQYQRLERVRTDCTGYGLAARFLGLGGGTTSAFPAFSSLRKNFWA